jgi:hypothetical protein
MVEADLMMLLDEGHTIHINQAVDLYTVQLGSSALFYGPSLQNALDKAVTGSNDRPIRSQVKPQFRQGLQSLGDLLTGESPL